MCGEECFTDFEAWWSNKGRFLHPGLYRELRHVFRWMISPCVYAKVTRKKVKFVGGKRIEYDTTPLTVFAHGGKTQTMVAIELGVTETTVRVCMRIIQKNLLLGGIQLEP